MIARAETESAIAPDAAAHLPAYPLTLRYGLVGAVLGAVVWLVTQQTVAGYAIFALLMSIGLVWNRRYVPIFVLVVAYQWLSITVGTWYSMATGVFPAAYVVGDIPQTVTIALTGLLLVALGIRVGWGVDEWWLRKHGAPAPLGKVRNLRVLFLIVLALFAVDYVYVPNADLSSGLNSVFVRLLELRQVLLLLLWFEVVRQRRNWTYLWLSFAWVFVPRLGGYYSDFKSPLMLLGLVYATSWTPWKGPWYRVPAAILKATPLIAVLLFLALLWQGGVKHQTRVAYDSGDVSRNPIDRIMFFVSNAREAAPDMLQDPQPAIEQLVGRISYVSFFSRVLDFVPKHEPFADGELLKLAVDNSLEPRLFFPDKPVLPNDSTLTRRFTGIAVSDIDTSISIGYMAEFYADWGLLGMFLSTFAFGCWLGLGALAISRFVRPPALVSPVLIVAFLHASEFETQFIKLFAAINLSVVMAILVLWIARKPIRRYAGLEDDAADETPTFAERVRAMNGARP